MKKYYVSIKVLGEEGFFHLCVYAYNEEEARENGLDTHLTNYYKHKGLATVVRVAEAEIQ